MQLDMCSKSPTTLLFLLFWAPGYTHIQLRSFNPPFYPSYCSREKSYQAFPGYIWNFSVCISEQGSLGARLHLHIVYTCQAEGEQLCTQDAHMLPGNYSSQISESWGLETGQLGEQPPKQPSNIKNEMTKEFIGAQCPTWPQWKNSCRNNYFWNSHITMHTMGQPIRLTKQQQWREVWKKGMPPGLQFKAHLVSRLELDTKA